MERANIFPKTNPLIFVTCLIASLCALYALNAQLISRGVFLISLVILSEIIVLTLYRAAPPKIMALVALLPLPIIYGFSCL
ncbi:MAG: hypothetical protein LKE81_07275 [Acetobacter sp.]|jgi:hypothetical protein|nr:hypothetical protein [Acetobacter sp.]MCH4088145.1 hypothetical protein [Acetobacter sp.]